MKSITNNYDSLKKDFNDIPVEYRLCLYVDFNVDSSSADIVRIVEKCAENKVGLIIPTVAHDDFDYVRPMNLIRIYGELLNCAEKLGIKVALNLEKSIEAAVVRYFDDEDESIRSRIILKREYFCTKQESLKIPIGDEVMSVVAVEEHGELIDLRPFVSEGELIWQAPLGNWRVCRYFCTDDEENDGVNLLNYEKCMQYLDAVLELFRNTLGHHIGNTLDTIAFSDICFSAVNRRNWDEGYNACFEKLYGFDPAPFYPCLYACDEDSGKRYKALLMDCRARMLAGGIMKALSFVADAEGMHLLGSLSEPKISASSWVLGDAMLVQAVSPCAKLEKSYLYGVNSLEIAQGAAEISGKQTVACDAFEEYRKINSDIIYRETATAFARGANMMMAHLPYDMDGAGDYAEFVGRLQSVLRHGDAVTDVALLYPIYSLHSEVSLFEASVRGGMFEYPETPDVTDYMSVINSISSYSGKDVSVIHPENLEESLKNGDYKVIVLPAAAVVSVRSMRIVADFFDRGGKVIGTGVLPSRAAEIGSGEEDPDAEVRRLARHIFGDGTEDENITGDYIYNSNENGGEAYFLYSTVTGIDRCNLVPCREILRALETFGIDYDVYISDMPRLECTGALNMNYPEYCLLGLSSGIRGGGMMSYIHKRNGDNDVYYFTNANDEDYDGFAYLKGEHALEIWDAKSGRITRVESSAEELNGAVYTKLALKLSSGESILFVAK